MWHFQQKKNQDFQNKILKLSKEIQDFHFINTKILIFFKILDDKFEGSSYRISTVKHIMQFIVDCTTFGISIQGMGFI